METDSMPSRTLPPIDGAAPPLSSSDRRGGGVLSTPSEVEQEEYVFAKVDAQRSATMIQVLALAGAALCITLAALLQNPINQQRKELDLVLQSDIYQGLPPKYAWVSAAGGTFRGVAANILWMRAEELKQEGKRYELHQLAKWICTLQPRFAAVWSFQAWNMSYNISVATHTTQERWQWVYNGIRLLRDEGIPNNERVVGLYHQLAWTYFHKVGERLDDYHLKYKRIWATTMEVLLGTPPTHLPAQEQVDYFKPVAEAPERLEDLFEQQPGTRALVEQLSDIGIDVQSTTKPVNLFHPLELNFFKPFTAYTIEQRVSQYRKQPRQPSEQDAKLYAFFDSAEQADLDALLAYLRAKVLREQYKMDPAFMLEMTTKLGLDEPVPIDWRTPWAHAMYWGMYGTEQGRLRKNLDEFHLLNTDRIVLFSLGALARQGDYILRPNLDQYEESFLDLRPDWRYVECVHQTSLELGRRYAEEGEDLKNTAGEWFRDYHINTLHSLLVGLFFSGHTEQAQKYYEYLAINYPDQFTGQTKEQYFNFRDFVQQQIKDMADSYHEINMLIHSLLSTAYMELVNGRHHEYTARGNEAFTLYQSYQRDRADDREGRRTLPPWEQMQADALAGFIVDPSQPIELGFMAWNREVNDRVKRRCYDDLRQVLEERYARSDLDINKAFPPPSGMEEWRASRPVETPEELSQKAAEERKERQRQQR